MHIILWQNNRFRFSIIRVFVPSLFTNEQFLRYIMLFLCHTIIICRIHTLHDEIIYFDFSIIRASTITIQWRNTHDVTHSSNKRDIIHLWRVKSNRHTQQLYTTQADRHYNVKYSTIAIAIAITISISITILFLLSPGVPSLHSGIISVSVLWLIASAFVICTCR